MSILDMKLRVETPLPDATGFEEERYPGSAAGNIRPPRGKFIVFDGIDGSGKTTMLLRASSYLRSLGVTVVETKQPGGSDLGDMIREILFKKIGTANIPNDALEMLFNANEIYNNEVVIKPALARGEWVLTDRYATSGLAYMDARGASPLTKRTRAELPVVSWDQFFLMDGDTKTLLERARARTVETHQGAKSWNDVETMRKVRSNFWTRYAKDPRTIIVDVTTTTSEEAFESVVKPALGRML